MRDPLPPIPTPEPTTLRQLLRELAQVRPAPPQRWAFALRAALAMGLPILAGIWFDDLSAGLMATLGAFTALYCAGRPYASRAITLAVVACAFSLAVMFGLWLENWPWLIVPVLTLVAMLATWLCNAVRLGPPGAYMFVLVCAAGTALPAEHTEVWQAGALVLGGGIGAWVLHTIGALIQLRGPERQAVAAAGRAVVAWLQAGTPQHISRHAAARALQESWQMLVGFQPIPARDGGELERLRGVNRELHLLFASSLDEQLSDERRQSLLARANALLEDTMRPAIRRPPSLPLSAIPHGYPRSWTRLRESLAPGSNALRVVLRVGVAALLAGALAAVMEAERAYWTIAAAVLMLHQGFDWPRTLLRSIQRTLGTWIGLLLAGLMLWWNPTGLWLLLMVMAMQFVIEIAVVRNYAIAVVFITGVALTIASGGQPVDDIGGLLLERGVDTLLGCACALFVFRLLPPHADAGTLVGSMVQCLSAIRRTSLLLASGDVTSTAARITRRELQQCSFQLQQGVDDALAGSRAQRNAAELWWPGISICQRLAYRVLAACWDTERNLCENDDDNTPIVHLRPDDMPPINHAIEALSQSLGYLTPPPALEPLPELLHADLTDLHDFLLRQIPAIRDQTPAPQGTV